MEGDKKSTASAQKEEYALLINGFSLSVIFEDDFLSKQIRLIFDACTAVIVYRSSPNEKAEVVKFVKGKSNQFTLAVGDGGNDVNMIQSASIGVGIMGKEGNQAAQFSDYAIPNFQGINKLVFVHGMPFGQRMIIFLIPMNLFKGLIYCTGTFVANFYNGFSGVALF
jgi:P-type E1-E2 ATPase